MMGLGNPQHRHTKRTNTTRHNKTKEMPFKPNFHRTVTSNLTFADRVRETQIELSDLAITQAICNALKEYWKHCIESGKSGDVRRTVTAKSLERLAGFIAMLGLVGLGNMITRGTKDS